MTHQHLHEGGDRAGCVTYNRTASTVADEKRRHDCGWAAVRRVDTWVGGGIVGGVGALALQRRAAVAQESCATDADCADDEICCAEVCRAIECCIDEDDPNACCPEGTSCFEGICEAVGGTDDDDDDDAPTLPSTGAGPGSAAKDASTGAMLAAGAAAALAARKLLQRSGEAEPSE